MGKLSRDRGSVSILDGESLQFLLEHVDAIGVSGIHLWHARENGLISRRQISLGMRGDHYRNKNGCRTSDS